MSPLAILVLSVGLAMDATAVAAARGLAAERVELRHTLAIAIAFGGAQAIMPLLGAWLGAAIGPSVEAWDHWIAFVLLGGLGIKMLHEARGAQREASEDAVLPERHPFGLRVLVVLAFATSIDAFAAGISLPMLGAPLAASIVTIGITTALLSAAGLHAGRRFGAMLGPRLDAFGGVVLIAMGTKILVEHLSAG